MGVFTMALAALAGAGLAAAPQRAPEGEYLNSYPYLEPFPMAGPPRANDLWAQMRLTINPYGRTVACTILASNLRRPETRWKACNTMLRYFAAAPAMRDGKPVSTELVRNLIVPGRESRHAAVAIEARRRQAEALARK
jgi:hypothetical protein